MCKLSKFLKLLGNVCIGLTVLVCLVFSVFTIPRFFGITPFVVQSGSMEPEIPTGSVVFTNTNDTDVKVGDVITYSLSTEEDTGVFVTHRVHDINDERGLIQTKGDNNDNPDGWLGKEAVTGTVIFHIPKVGFILDKLQQKGFVVLAIWVFVINILLMIVPYILDLICGKGLSEIEALRQKVKFRNINAENNKKGDGEEYEK